MIWILFLQFLLMLPQYAEEIIKSWAPPPDYSTSQWAEAERHLAKGIAAEAGKWRNSRVPFLPAIMDAADDPNVKIITVMKSSQVAITEAALNICGKRIDIDPCSILFVRPTLESARELSKKRFTRGMIECTPALENKISVNTRDADNVILAKQFPGGHITFAGANSPTSMKSQAIKLIIFDEADEFKSDLKDQGDIVEMAKRRSITFSDSLLILISTPTIKGFSRIEKAFEESNRQYYYVPCFKCGTMQRLFWSGVKWPKGKPELAQYQCDNPKCREHWSDARRLNALQYGKWIAERPEIIEHAGFHIWAAYSPWVRLGQLAETFLNVKNDPPRLKVFVNQDLGQTWEESGDSIDPAKLMARVETYPAPVPMGGLVLNAGIDIQKTWVEGVIRAWGIDQESWLIERFYIVGDFRKPQIKQELEDKLNKVYEHESGIKLRISGACIDSGYLTSQVYQFVAGKESRRIFATKGLSQYGTPIISKFTQNRKYGIKIFQIGTDNAKDVIFPRLGIEKPGPGYYHFPVDTSEEYFEGLCSEKGVSTYYKGRAVTIYKKLRERNEPLDCEVLALANIEILDPPFQTIAQRLQTTEKESKVIKKNKHGGWVNKWRKG